MRYWFMGVVLLFMAQLLRGAEADDQANGKFKKDHTKIVLIGHAKDGHPYRTHEYMPGCELLAKCLTQTPGVRTVISQGWPSDPQIVTDADALVLYVPWGANILFDGPQREAAQQMLNSGVGLTALHWSTGANGPEFGQLWLDQLGAWFHTDFSRLEHVEKRLAIVDTKTPVNNGLHDFNLFDEFYFGLRFADAAQPLAKVETSAGTETVAWLYQRPNSQDGRSFGCVCGHYHKNFGNDRFRQLVVNGILWSAHRELPAQGAPCKLESADLQVPKPASAAN